jgi:cell division protein FtsZ
VVHEALNHPLLDVDTEGATGVLIHVTGGPYMTLEAASQVVDLMTAKVSDEAHVIWGARQDPGFGDTIKVMAIITGVGGKDLQGYNVSADKLGEALKLTRKKQKSGSGTTGFQRFD